ncbi:Trypsin-2 [Blomia tropicalis]|nr:Trypsin-2 [Blomia tropicalis]
MNFLLILFFLASLKAFGHSTSLDKSKQIEESNIKPYITNGRNAMDGEAPWQVAFRDDLQFYLCGGTILTKQWIATAVQCVEDLLKQNLTIRYNTLSLEGGITIKVKSVVQHPSYNPTSHKNDIALVSTETDMILNQMNAKKATLPAMPITIGRDLNITGWGNTQWGASGFSKDLQIATLITGDRSDCNNTYNGMITSSMFCAKSNPPYHCTTNGDRGGPGINSKLLYGIIITWADCSMYQGYEVFTDVDTVIIRTSRTRANVWFFILPVIINY